MRYLHGSPEEHIDILKDRLDAEHKRVHQLEDRIAELREALIRCAEIAGEDGEAIEAARSIIGELEAQMRTLVSAFLDALYPDCVDYDEDEEKS